MNYCDWHEKPFHGPGCPICARENEANRLAMLPDECWCPGCESMVLQSGGVGCPCEECGEELRPPECAPAPDNEIYLKEAPR